MPNDTINGLKKAGIDFMRGRAHFTDRNSISVGHQQLSASFIVLATGAVPMQLPLKGAQFMVTSSEFMGWTGFPAGSFLSAVVSFLLNSLILPSDWGHPGYTAHDFSGQTSSTGAF